MTAPSTPTDPRDSETETPAENPGTTRNQQQYECPDPDSQSPLGKTLTPEAPDPGAVDGVDEEYPHGQQAEVDSEWGPEPEREPSVQECRREEGDEDISMMDSHGVTSPTVSRRGGGPRRKKGTQKKRAAEKRWQEKLKVLVETLNPVPFAPAKTLDISGHEKLLKRLGLWDFVHMEFDRSIKSDLVAQLIASYNSVSRCSYVNGSRINVSRADLARALKLPVKKEKLVMLEDDKDIMESEESMKFLEEFVSTWVLLHDGDTWMMPDEVVEWKKSLNERHLERLDWAALFWFMVEKELTAAPQLCDCYYASHMQSLIKCQKEDLLTEEPKNDEEADVKEVEVQDEDDGGGDMNMAERVEEIKEEQGLEEHKVELNLDQESDLKTVPEREHDGDEQVMDLDVKKAGEQERWVGNSSSNMSQPFLRPCIGVGDVDVTECDNGKELADNGQANDEEEEEQEEEEVEEDEKHEGGFPLFPNNDSLDGVPSANIIGEIGEGSPVAFGSELQIRSAGEFLGSRADLHLLPGSSVLFSGSNKREIDNENDISHHIHAGKRLRTGEPSWNDKSFDFHACAEHVQYWIEKARMSYAEKERAFAESSFNQQMLVNELQTKEGMIQNLHKIQYEELHRRDMEIYKLETELHLMESVLEGYRRALKKTQQALREHREHCQMHEEPLYKDVKGSRGLVLSAIEVEKLRLKQEEEDRIKRTLIERKMKELEDEWLVNFGAHEDKVRSLGTRLSDIENQVKLLRELQVNRKSSPIPESAASHEN